MRVRDSTAMNLWRLGSGVTEASQSVRSRKQVHKPQPNSMTLNTRKRGP